ncbi:MAG: glycosyltransferase [Bacteroidetes bacterium]|nr:MAG: glycosyltransferase [Bacteroidota bacterium]
MKISIITVCYNSEATLEATICSVIEQDHADIEFIVVDGESTDKTTSIIEKYKKKITRHISEKDDGMYFAVNKGISLATGDAVGILNSDDVYADNRVISRVVKEFQLTKTDCIYGDLQYISRDKPEKVIRRWKSKSYHPTLFLKGWMPPHPTFFVKRSCYHEFGNFNTSFSISADYELMLRFLYKHKATASYIDKVLVKMRTGGISNVSLNSRITANREDRRAWKINGLKAGILTLLLKPLSKLRQFFGRS